MSKRVGAFTKQKTRLVWLDKTSFEMNLNGRNYGKK